MSKTIFGDEVIVGDTLVVNGTKVEIIQVKPAGVDKAFQVLAKHTKTDSLHYLWLHLDGEYRYI